MTLTETTQLNQLPGLLKSGNREALSTLYDQYAACLNGIICKIVHNPQAAEEILQDVFVKIWKNIEKYDASKGTLFTWMLNITRNTSIDYLRSKRHAEQSHTAFPVHFETSDTIPALPYNPENTEIRVFALKLEHKYRQIIDLVYFWGYSQEEVSKLLGIPLGTVKTRSRQGLHQWRRLFMEQQKD